jgi:hypothetical protein
MAQEAPLEQKSRWMSLKLRGDLLFMADTTLKQKASLLLISTLEKTHPATGSCQR